MARTAVGAITIQDVQDGIHPISLVLSNQSHTFAGDNEGTVVAGEIAAFSSEVYAYVGVTRATYDSAASPANNTYKLGTIAYDTAGWTAVSTVAASQVKITMSVVPTGTTNKSVVITVPVIVTNSVGNATTVNMLISLAKLIEGADGASVTLTPTKQTIAFSELGVATDTADIIIPIVTVGNTGALSAYYARNGATSWTALTVGATVNKAKEIDIDGANDNDHITISTINFGTADVFTVKVAGASSGSDIISIIKIQDGATGEAALTVSISSSVGGFSFKNNSGTTKVLTVVVYDNATGSVITPTSFQWRKNGTNVANATTSTISITPTDITDGGSEEYSCLVTTT
jgi:hypothetical protein